MSYRASSKDPNTAMLIEIVGGYMGLLGLGHFYAGYTLEGVIRLLGWMAALLLVIFLLGPLSILFGLHNYPVGLIFTLIFTCMWGIPFLLAPVISGVHLKNRMESGYRSRRSRTQFDRRKRPRF